MDLDIEPFDFVQINQTNSSGEFSWIKCNTHVPLQYQQYLWVSAIISASLSLFGSSFMLYTALDIFLGRDRILEYFNTNPGEGVSRLVSYLAIGEYFWAIYIITNFSLILYHKQVLDHALCVFFRGWFQISAGSTVCWNACIAVYVHLMLFNLDLYYRNSQVIIIIFNVASYGIPTLCFLILLLIENGITENAIIGDCFPAAPYDFYLWVMPNSIIFTFTLVLYIVILVKLTQFKNRKKEAPMRFSREPRNTMEIDKNKEIPGSTIYGNAVHDQDSGIFNDNYDYKNEVNMLFYTRVSFFLIVFLICWAGDVITYFVQYFLGCTPFLLYFTYVILLEAQGFFDSLVYGYTSMDFRKYYSTYSIAGMILLVIVSPIAVWGKIFHFLGRKIAEWHRKKKENTW